jgi:hypothetical protein
MPLLRLLNLSLSFYEDAPAGPSTAPPSTDDNIWLWLGPVLGGIFLLVGVGGAATAFFIIRHEQ